MKIDTRAENNTRQLAGIVKAGTIANVAFEIGGSVIVMARKVGEAVAKGDTIAQLDPKPIELEVAQAEFSLKQAEAALKDARSKLSQQQQLWEKRFSTRTALDTAKANFGNADGQVGIARSQLSLRKRDLAKTTLKAPFDGRISKREVEVFEEVKAGEAIYTLQTQGENEVEVSVPETLIGFVNVGLAVEVKISPLNGATIKGLVTEVAPEAGDANAFPVTVRLETSPPDLRPGMSAEIIIAFKGEATGKAFSVPVGALKPDINANQATVFVYDPATKTVRQKAVQVVGIEGNNPEIIGEIKPGDIIATAGVGQMYDGMKVRLLAPGKLF
jgi:RND family efflux transporter MFP subunit